MKLLKTILVSILFLLLGPLSAFSYGQEIGDSPIESQKNKIEDELYRLERLYENNRDSVISRLEFLIDSCEKSGFKYGMARSMSQKSWGIWYEGKYEESLRLAHSALEVQREIHDSLGMSYTYKKIAICNLKSDRLLEAEKYLNESLKISRIYKDTFNIYTTILTYGSVKHSLDEFEEAIVFYQEALAIPTIMTYDFEVAMTEFNIGTVYLDLNVLDSARKYLFSSLEKMEGIEGAGNAPPLTYIGMGYYYMNSQNYKRAIDYFNHADSLALEQNDLESLLLVKENLSKAYSQSNNWQQAYTAQADFISFKNQIDSLNNARIIAEVEEKYNKVENQNKLLKLNNEKAIAENVADKLALFIVLIGLVILLLGLTLYIWNYRKNQKQQSEKTEYKASLAESKLVALKAQMNPHFVFNCINTTQNFVLNSQKEMAYEYLTSFAKLLRLILDNSSLTFVPLEHEIEQLNLYLKLESLRFEKSFSFQVDVEDELNSGVFEIPGMIIQPIIENAILHGLVNKKEGSGMIKVSLSKEGNILICKVLDNGIGRELAAQIKLNKEVHYKSTAIPNIQNRLELLNKNLDIQLQLETTDLYDEGKPSGTLVTIHLPLM